MRYFSFLVLFLMFPATVYPSMPMVLVEYTCPIDGAKFSNREGGSDCPIGAKLDLEPVTESGNSYPRPVAHCPNDGMIMYRPSFTPREVAILKEYVPTIEYRQMVKEDTTYWRAAKLKEKLGAPLNDRWFTMLQATWQASSDKYESYARETIKALEALSANLPEDKKQKDYQIWHWQMLRGELYRRVGDFDKAKAIFEGLMARLAIKADDFHPSITNYELELIINYELELIAKKDQASHEKPGSKPPDQRRPCI